MTANDRLARIEEAIASLYEAICAFKPPAGRHTALREIVAEVATRSGGAERRPYTLPEQRQASGEVK